MPSVLPGPYLYHPDPSHPPAYANPPSNPPNYGYEHHYQFQGSFNHQQAPPTPPHPQPQQVHQAAQNQMLESQTWNK